MEEDSLEFIPILDFQDSLQPPPFSNDNDNDDSSLRLGSPDIPNITMDGILPDLSAELGSATITLETEDLTGQQRRRRGRPRTSSKNSLKPLQSACEHEEVKPSTFPSVAISSVETKKEKLDVPDYSPEELEPPPLPSDDEKDEDYVPCEKKPAIKKRRRKANPNKSTCDK